MKIYNTSEPIVNHYINLINAGKKTIKDVPAKFQEEVAELLGISLTELTLEEVKENKIAEMSAVSEKVIINGTDIQLSDGTIKHYSFTSNDQANIKNLFDLAVVTQADGIPYHADNDMCELYSCADIIAIYIAEQKFILYHNTYFNTLKQYIKSLTTVEEVEAVVYGQELNAEYTAIMQSILTQSAEVFAIAMEKYGITVAAE